MILGHEFAHTPPRKKRKLIFSRPVKIALIIGLAGAALYQHVRVAPQPPPPVVYSVPLSEVKTEILSRAIETEEGRRALAEELIRAVDRKKNNP